MLPLIYSLKWKINCCRIYAILWMTFKKRLLIDALCRLLFTKCVHCKPLFPLHNNAWWTMPAISILVKSVMLNEVLSNYGLARFYCVSFSSVLPSKLYCFARLWACSFQVRKCSEKIPMKISLLVILWTFWQGYFSDIIPITVSCSKYLLMGYQNSSWKTGQQSQCLLLSDKKTMFVNFNCKTN